MRESDVVRARFWTAAAHELRTPLAIAQSYLEVVLSDLAEDLPERPTQLLKTASESLTRLERLISDVLDAAVTGRARSTLRLAGHGPRRGPARPRSRRSRRPRSSAGLRLSVEIPKGLPKIAGDREKVERLVTNLVDHSLRRVPRGGPDVRLLASASGEGEAVVQVVDGGPTLTPEKAAHLFDDVGSARGGRRIRAVGRAPARGRDGREAHRVRRSGRIEREVRRLDARRRRETGRPPA